MQERRHPELKGTRSEPFTRTGKAMLVPAGSDLAPRIDAWLRPQIEAGMIQTMLERK